MLIINYLFYKTFWRPGLNNGHFRAIFQIFANRPMFFSNHLLLFFPCHGIVV